MKSAKANIQAWKKRKSKTSSVFNIVYDVKDNQLNITDTSNTERKSGTWFWNKNVNGNNLDTKEDRYSNNSNRDENEKKGNQEEEESKI